jgi:hypothetical protein
MGKGHDLGGEALLMAVQFANLKPCADRRMGHIDARKCNVFAQQR